MFGGGEDKRNLIIAVAAIFVILLGWQFLMPALFPQPERPPVTEQQQTTPREQTVTAPGDPTQVDTPSPEEIKADRQATSESPRVTVDAARVRGSISLVGARFDQITLRDYFETTDEGSPEIVLLSPRDSKDPYFVDFGWVSTDQAISMPATDTLWTADRNVLRTGEPVTLTWDNGEGLTFVRRIAIDENFVFSVTDEVRNTGNSSVDIAAFSRIARFTVPVSTQFKPLFIFEEGALGVIGEEYRDADYGDLQDAYFAKQDNPRVIDENRFEGSRGWMGITDKYWLVALIPDQEREFRGSFEYLPVEGARVDSYQAIYQSAPFSVPPGQAISLTSHLFTGAKEIGVLDLYEENLGAERFDLAVDFGPTWFLSKPMFHIIDFFNKLTGNFGVAILLLTICVRIVLFPLANKAYESMSRMRKLQPEMIRLRERYKEDKQRMNQELMGLYKKEKANPLAGCLPLLIQLPVFFALYYMLFVTIEMRHAPFFGWIQDLSGPDPLTFITGFGFAEWPAPDFLLIGIWPILFAVTMWLQMKLNPQPMEPIQQKILLALPFVFLFLFARFPSGLVVYWTWNNVLSIAQQWLIMHRMGITRESLAADAEKIKKIKEAAEKGTLIKPSGSQRRKTSSKSSKSRTSSTTGKAKTTRKRRTATKDETPTRRKTAQRPRMTSAAAAAAKRRRQQSKKAAAKAKAAAATKDEDPPRKSRRERKAERAARAAETQSGDSSGDGKPSGARDDSADSGTGGDEAWTSKEAAPARRTRRRRRQS